LALVKATRAENLEKILPLVVTANPRRR